MPRFHQDRTQPGADWIFVFGSNLAGHHAGGAARAAAERFDAEWGVGEGVTGRAYALPTMDENLDRRSLAGIAESVERFLNHARSQPDHLFFVTRVGCGIAGFDDEQIAPLFRGAPDNCSFAMGWRMWIEDQA